MPPQHSRGYGNTLWSTGCGGGIPGQPAPPPSQTCQQRDATLLRCLQTARVHDIPDTRENIENKISFSIYLLFLPRIKFDTAGKVGLLWSFTC